MPQVQPLIRSARTPRAGLRGVPFTRKAWDDPIKYKLSRSYGDEFEYDNFAQMQRRWNMQGVGASAFAFPGGSAVEFYPSTNQGLWMYAPSGDFEAVLEFSPTKTGGGMCPSIGLLDSTFAGYATSFYDDGNVYTWVIGSSMAYSSTSNNLGSHGTTDGRHCWIALRRTGSTVQGRFSTNGTSWGSLAGSGSLAPATYNRIAIFKPWSTDPGWTRLHRFNVYPGPTFFPG